MRIRVSTAVVVAAAVASKCFPNEAALAGLQQHKSTPQSPLSSTSSTQWRAQLNRYPSRGSPFMGLDDDDDDDDDAFGLGLGGFDNDDATLGAFLTRPAKLQASPLYRRR